MNFETLSFDTLSHSIMYIIAASPLVIDERDDQYILDFIDIAYSITSI